MKKHLALITYSGLPHGAESERLMLPYLASEGIVCEFVDWRDGGGDLGRFDLLILRTCWDYHLNVKEFTAWLQRTAKVVPVLNAVETVLWNHNKFYLREWQQQGHQIAPTVFVCGAELIQTGQWNEILGWEKIVVKPAVSATAHKTWLFDRATLPNIDELKHKIKDEA